jgi:hypothetical protein
MTQLRRLPWCNRFGLRLLLRRTNIPAMPDYDNYLDSAGEHSFLEITAAALRHSRGIYHKKTRLQITPQAQPNDSL